jgi:uncharacterized protein (TIGR00251 family)
VPEARLSISVVPGARKSELSRAEDGAYRMRVGAPAREGKANRELLRYLSTLLEVPPSSLTVERGGASRHKVIAVRGLGEADLHRRLQRAIEG